ncbi:MAG: transposase [Pseudonocardiales bacterium]|nr:transposase [Pseudonocardiales bacterium]
MAKKGRRATNEERLVAIQMHDNGLSADRIAEIMGVSRSSVFDWIANYREGGLAAISTKFASGRPTALDDDEMIRLFTMINGKDPRTYSFGVALWTRALIRDLIKKKFSKGGRWSRWDGYSKNSGCCPRTTSCAQAGTTSRAEVRRGRSCHVRVLFSHRGESVF